MSTVSQMTKEELKGMIADLIEQKLLELVGDPDEGLPMRKALRDRLLRQRRATLHGARGEPLTEAARRLGLS